MAEAAIPTGNPGELFIPGAGVTIKQVEWREDDYCDTVQAPLAPTAGQAFEFFRDLSDKNIPHTNLKTQRRIPAGSEFIITRIGVLIHQAYGNVILSDADYLKAAYNASLEFKINDRLIVEGLLVKFQSGLGVTGSTTRGNTGIVTTGIPSAAAAPVLMVAQTVKDNDDLNGKVQFWDNAWLTKADGTKGTQMPTFAVRPVIQLLLHGLMKKPQGK